jgi:cyclopropane fatty-acyl-phospholipid synthase-like methyltransferase
MKNENQKRMDEIYRNTPLEDIPWNRETPPDLLVHLVDTGKVQPCRAIDLGCGAGNYVIYLASKGFDVTGVDFSPTAINLAKKNAKSKGVDCSFIVADVTNDFPGFNQGFDFAYDWGLLHHVFPEYRKTYVKNIYNLLNPKGKYLSLCFSEKDEGFEREGKYSKTDIGSTLYFSSEDELRELFAPSFDIIELYTTRIAGKFETHTFNYVFMSKK